VPGAKLVLNERIDAASVQLVIGPNFSAVTPVEMPAAPAEEPAAPAGGDQAAPSAAAPSATAPAPVSCN
jgi:hypothetical protein